MPRPAEKLLIDAKLGHSRRGARVKVQAKQADWVGLDVARSRLGTRHHRHAYPCFRRGIRNAIHDRHRGGAPGVPASVRGSSVVLGSRGRVALRDLGG